MKRNTLITIVGAAAAILATVSVATSAEIVTESVKTHPSQGDVTVVEGATARLASADDGIFVGIDTSGLTPGNVHTLWLVVVNQPAACEADNCTSKDVLKRSDAVSSDVGYAGGVIVGDDSKGKFAWFQPAGKLHGPWFGNGLAGPTSAEIHLVINDHGPAIDGRVADMLSTYRDGCTDASIPAPMPDTARAQGEPGPNQCRLVQFAVFQQPSEGL